MTTSRQLWLTASLYNRKLTFRSRPNNQSLINNRQRDRDLDFPALAIRKTKGDETMDDIATLERTTADSRTPLKLDAVVIGAGVGGLYQLHLLRSQGLEVKAFDAAADVGGTWYWNRYPGARLDSESHSYQFLFSQELYEGWDWTERFSAQPEIERWLQYVADRLDLRKDIQFNTTIKSAHFDEQTNRWTVTTDRG